MSDKPGNMKVFFKRGLRALLPTVLTVAVFAIAINFLYDTIAQPINTGLKRFLVDTPIGNAPLQFFFDIDVEDDAYRLNEGEPGYDPKVGEVVLKDEIRAELDERFYNWIGFVIAIILIFVFGFFLATFLGSRIFARVEGILERFPGVKVVYPYAKQPVEFFTTEKKMEFHSVVALEWPRKGVWALGFVTGNGFKDIDERADDILINVFFPSCPTPVTGYVMFIPAKDLLLLPITVDEAIRFIISGGVLVPPSEKVEGDKFEQIPGAGRALHIPPLDKTGKDDDA